MRIYVLCFLAFMVGCGEHRDTQANSFPTRAVEVPSPPSTKAEVVPLESQSSNNAMQQSLTAAVGASVGKFAEKIDASLARIDATVNAKFEAVTTAQAEIKSQIALESKIDAALNASVKANADLKAELSAKLEALANAQAQAVAGLGNKIETKQESISAGGNVTQFPTEVRDVIVNAQNATSWNIRIMCGVLTAVLAGKHLHDYLNHRKQMAAITTVKATPTIPPTPMEIKS